MGREQAGGRPVLIVSGEEYHDTVTTLALAVPLTTRDRGWDNHVRLTGAHGLGVESFAMTEQVAAIGRERLGRCTGMVEMGCLAAVRAWIRD